MVVSMLDILPDRNRSWPRLGAEAPVNVAQPSKTRKTLVSLPRGSRVWNFRWVLDVTAHLYIV